MNQSRSIISEIQKFGDISPSGFAVGFHIEYTKATYMFESYPKEWLTFYGENGFLLSDPTVVWGFQNDGWVDWEDLRALDTSGVLEKAADFGLKHGITCALETGDLRTIGSFARNDRQFTKAESETLFESVNYLNKITKLRKPIETNIVQQVKNMGITLSQNLI